jgi:restriction endonuclease
MGVTKAKKKNKNEFKKVYPYIRRRPVYTYELDKEMFLEEAKIEFIESSSETYVFTEIFPSAPTVTAVSFDDGAGNNVNVNVFISTISTTSVTIETSDVFTGFVNIHAIYVAP